MKIYEIKNKEEVFGYLFYNKKIDDYYIELNTNTDNQPIFFNEFIKKGMKNINSYWTKRWVDERVIPYSRQNINSILKINDFTYYDELEIFIKMKGKSSMDDTFIDEIKIDDLPLDIKERRNKTIIDFMKLKENNIIVFFKNGEAKICNLEYELVEPFLSSFGNEIIDNYNHHLDYLKLYELGKKSPILYDDLITFLKTNIYTSDDVRKELNVSRQYISQIKNSKIKEVSKDIYLKNDVILSQNK